jgi:hypothetical protein
VVSITSLPYHHHHHRHRHHHHLDQPQNQHHLLYQKQSQVIGYKHRVDGSVILLLLVLRIISMEQVIVKSVTLVLVHTLIGKVCCLLVELYSIRFDSIRFIAIDTHQYISFYSFSHTQNAVVKQH